MNQVDTPISVIDSAFYEPLSHVLWAVALSWIIFACVHGYGGPINWFLSWPQWQPLSRLSYSIYLCHSTILEWHAKSIHTSMYFSDYNAVSSIIYIVQLRLKTTFFNN